MKVRVTLTIDVDSEAWQQVYGDKPSAAEVRAYVIDTVHSQLVEAVEVATSVRAS